MYAATYEQAERAAKALDRKFHSYSWWRGVAVERSDKGFIVSVRVAQGAHPELPQEYSGVRVRTLNRQLAHAFTEK